MTRRKKKDGLESKVMSFPAETFKYDNNGQYFPFCGFGFHRGLILDENVCKTRQCVYYSKIYIRYGHNKK